MKALYGMMSGEMLVFLILLSTVLEIGLYTVLPLQKIKKAAVGCFAISLGLASGLWVMSVPTAFTMLFAILSVYRVINLLRIIEARRHPANLKKSAQRSGLVLGISQFGLLIGGLILGGTNLNIPLHEYLFFIAVLQLILGGLILVITIRNLAKTKFDAVVQSYADRDLPTLTVAIPARNETAELEDCLRSVIASDYPKLEILVLDDCSQDKTPEIIRQFAQDGVRFISGEEPKDGWLAKNQAYDTLATQASGQFILFCGVDIRLNSHSIRALVSAALANQKDMISVLPKRYEGGIEVSIIQPMRYWWELALPRRLFNRPAVLSSLWLIRKNAIKQAGGFAAVSNSILPEAFFARELIKKDAYSLVRSGGALDVQTTKKLNEQRNTAIRMRYPQFRRRLENLLSISLTELVVLFAPFVLAIAGFWVSLGEAHALSIATCVVLIATHCLIITATNPSNWWIAVVNFPVVVLCEVALAHISMWKYEFSVVEWKGRNVCLPVMRAIPRLPKI